MIAPERPFAFGSRATISGSAASSPSPKSARFAGPLKLAALVFVFVVTFSFAVAAGDARPLSIPSAGAVERIVIVARPGEAVIKDRAVIERFLAFLTAHNDRWRQPWDTFPTPQWTIRLEGKEISGSLTALTAVIVASRGLPTNSRKRPSEVSRRKRSVSAAGEGTC